MLEILLKKSVCRSVAKLYSDTEFALGILVQRPTLRDSILSIERNKTKHADFFNRILEKAVIRCFGHH